MQSVAPKKSTSVETWKTTLSKVSKSFCSSDKLLIPFWLTSCSIVPLEEVTLAMEEIAEKEKDLKQLVEVTSFLFERSQDLTYKSEEQSNQLQVLLAEQGKIEDAAH